MSSVEQDDAGVIPAPAKAARAARPASRVRETRTATQRPAIGGEYRGRLHIDTALLDPSRDYTWIREETLGERDKGNIQDALDAQGYDPVSASDHPELAGKSLPGWEDKDKLVRRGGLVLMSRPKPVALAAKAQQHQETQDALRSVARELETTRGRGDPQYLQKPRDEQIAVTVDRGDTGTGLKERFRDA